jgi:chromosome partitioning protein
MAHTLVITNRKGGTGKTTSSVNLAAEFAARGQRVLLVDLDTQCHCALGLGVTLEKNDLTSHGIFTDPSLRLSSTIRPTIFPNLFLSPADQLFEHGSGQRDERVLARALADEEIDGNFDLILVDTPPSLDLLLLNALSAVRWALIPFVPHHLSGEGVKQLARLFFKVATGSNPNLRILGFLPVMQDSRIGQHRNVVGDIAHQFGAARLLPGIRTDIKLVEAFAHGQPVRSYAPKSRGAQDYALAADELMPLLS